MVKPEVPKGIVSKPVVEIKPPAPKQPPQVAVNNIFNKNNLNAAKQVEVKPVPSGRVATA